MSRNVTTARILIIAVSLLFGTFANATVIRSAVVATASIVNESTRPTSVIGKAIDQSGLSSGYTSGVTDFDAYLSTMPTHDGTPGNAYLSENTFFDPLTIQFDLGAAFLIDRIAFWNGNERFVNAITGINAFTLLVSNVADFSVSTNLGPQSLAMAFADVPIGAEVLTLASATTGRYVRMDITSNHGNPGHYGLAEVAFSTATAVPEPTTLALLDLGIAGLGFSRKNRSA